ncbi:hypothetical protein Tco_0239681, partial [Tanacetum coccineum]
MQAPLGKSKLPLRTKSKQLHRCTIRSLISSFFRVFGALCYPTNDSENLGKLQPRADIEIFIGYAQQGPSDPIIIKRMGELEGLIANLVEENQAL